MSTLAPIGPALDGAVGCDSLTGSSRVYFVEFDGEIDYINIVTGQLTYVGSGYGHLEDIALSSDGRHAYVTEREGNLLKVDLQNGERINAQVIATGMTAPHQISLDEAHNRAFIVEFAPSGRLLQVNLAAHTWSVVVSGLQSAVGLAVTSDLSTAYVTEQTGGKLTRVNLLTRTKSTIHTGLNAPFFLTWFGTAETSLITTERDPFNNVLRIDISTVVPTVTHLASGVPTRPSSTAVISPTELIVFSDAHASRLTLTSFTANKIIFLGVGNVPFDRIFGGYADTTSDPAYPYQYKDCPFGGTLPLVFNHTFAYVNEGARFYRLQVDGVDQPTMAFTDYKYNSVTMHDDAVANPTAGVADYEVRADISLWPIHPTLGLYFDTTHLTDGLHTFSFHLYNGAHVEIGSPGDAGRSLKLLIDNKEPIAQIENVFHAGVVVPACSIVSIAGNDNWTFEITASQSNQHLRSWILYAVWGDNKSGGVDSASYVPVPSRLWGGIANSIVPAPMPPKTPWQAAVLGDSSSTKCAHTFVLLVYDRVINGIDFIHSAEWTRSITILP